MNLSLLDKIILDRKDELVSSGRLSFFKSDGSEGWLLDGARCGIWKFKSPHKYHNRIRTIGTRMFDNSNVCNLEEQFICPPKYIKQNHTCVFYVFNI